MNEELKFLRKFTQKNWGGGVGSGRVGLGGQGGCERRIEVFCVVKIHKKLGRGGGVGGLVRGSGWVVRVDVNEELKFL